LPLLRSSDSLAIEIVDLDDLPEGWPDEDSVQDTASYASEWARSLRTAILRAPSAAVRAEYNYILNPLHPDFRTIRFDVPETEHIDDSPSKHIHIAGQLVPPYFAA